MADWVALLVGSVLFGASIVAGLILPRHSSVIALVAGLGALFGAITSFGRIASLYDSSTAIGGSMVVFIASITAGYAIASSSLPYLQHVFPTPDVKTSPDGGDGVILIACCDPERYDPRVVATRQNLLNESADIVVPVTALPFVFFAEKARYRAVGGRAPGRLVARQIAERVSALPIATNWRVELAWCHKPDSLARQVGALAASGSSRIALVPLGLPESGPLDEARKLLAESLRGKGDLRIETGPDLWNDRMLPERLTERILSATSGAAAQDVGVVLVGEGVPASWERRFSAASAAETYFNQRVRSLLDDAGIDAPHVRMAWLDWQTPDVTEAVRHLAALGALQIVVAPSTISLPTLETILDMGHAIALARVPEGVRVVTLQPWGDDEGFAEAIARSADAAFQELDAGD